MINFKEVVNGKTYIREVSAIHFKTSDGVVHTITFLHRKDTKDIVRLLWEAINSCFGSGYWIDAKPWSDTDGWRDLP